MTVAAPRSGVPVGIDAMHVYAGRACVGVRDLFEARGLNLARFANLRMQEKSVPLPCEDAVTNAVNAAKPLVERMEPAERDEIELLITATESAVDFGKATSTWIHEALGLSRNCRLFEVKQACYAATAALQMAAAFVAANPRSGVRALVVSTDHPVAVTRGTYHEPSQGTMGVAMLVTAQPRVLELDFGASGCFAYNVADACRPAPGAEEGDAQLTLFSYLDCLVGSYRDYCDKVGDADLMGAFRYLAFHTPFGGMVVAAHRKLLSTFAKLDRAAVAADFERRVEPSLHYCERVGNGYSASLYLALCGLLDHAVVERPVRLGLFSYGSGCSAEFFSGVVTPDSRKQVAAIDLPAALAGRRELSIAEYDAILEQNETWGFGVERHEVDVRGFEDVWRSHFEGAGLYVLDSVDGYQRSYRWS